MRQKTLFYTTALVLSILFISCKSDSNTVDNDQDSDSTEVNDTMNKKDVAVDTSTQSDEDTVEVVYEDPEVQEAHEEIVKKYGTQWDFCTCVQKSDSVNTALMEASDDEFDAVMERSEYIDNKCKGLLIQPNATPEDRAKHEIKVKKCLDSK